MIFTSVFTHQPAILPAERSRGLEELKTGRGVGVRVRAGPVPGRQRAQLQLEFCHWAACLTGIWALCYHTWDTDRGGWGGTPRGRTLHSQGRWITTAFRVPPIPSRHELSSDRSGSPSLTYSRTGPWPQLSIPLQCPGQGESVKNICKIKRNQTFPILTHQVVGCHQAYPWFGFIYPNTLVHSTNPYRALTMCQDHAYTYDD